MRKAFKVAIFIAALLWLFPLLLIYAADETITITTYYPSPYGSYNELSTTGNTTLATTNSTYLVGIGNSTPLHKLDITGAMYSRRYAATTTIDWNNGNTQSLTLAAGVNGLTFSNGQDGGKYVLILKQDAAASTVSWPATVRWSGGTAPILSSGSSKTDYIGFVYNGVDSKYDGVAQQLNF